MKSALTKIVFPLGAVFLAASLGTAYAMPEAFPSTHGRPAIAADGGSMPFQKTEVPPDCKKDPEDPRCKKDGTK